MNTYTPYAAIYAMGQDIQAALRDLEISCTEYLSGNYAQPKLYEAMMLMLGQHKGNGFVLEFNGRGNVTVMNPKVGEVSLFDAWRLPKVSWLTDNPCHHMDKLRSLPDYSILGVVDRDFLDWLPQYGLNTRRTFFMPHGGPEPLRQQADTADRQIDVLYIGNIREPEAFGAWLDRVGDGDTLVRQCMEQAFGLCLQSDAGLYQTVSRVFEEAGISLSLDDLLKRTRQLEQYLIPYRRISVLKNVKRSRVVVCGDIDPAVSANFSSSITFLEKVTFEDFQDLAMNARIILNTSPSFRNGAHERVFYGLSRGAHILTEPSRFLAPEVEKGLGISFLDFDPSEIDNAIEAVLDRKDELDDQRQRALDHYGQTHTWKQRVHEALDILQEEFWDPDKAVEPAG